MARTAPVPNIPPIPGMNPCTWVMGGGAGGGGSGSGSGGKGSGKAGADGDSNKADPEGGGENSKACGQGSGAGCPNPKHGAGSGTAAGDPVDILTGRVYTIGVSDLELPGPLSFSLYRTYDSTLRDRDVGLGSGWSHSLAWEIKVGRRRMKLTNGLGITWELPLLAVGEETLHDGMRILREQAAFNVTVGFSGLTYRFEPEEPVTHRDEVPGGRYVLIAVSDAYANGLALSYQRGLLVGFTDSAGRSVRVRRAGDRIAAFEVENVDTGGWVSFRTYEYDQRGDLIAARDGYGHATRHTYDASHLLTSQTTPEGRTVYHRYDGRFRCVETWCERPGDQSLAPNVPPLLANGITRAKGVLHVAIEYGDDFVEVATSRGVRRYLLKDGAVDKMVFAGGVHDSRYDSQGNLVQYVDAAGSEWVWTYDPVGQTRSERGPLGDTIRWDYDERGRVAREIRPLGDAIEYFRDRFGTIVQASDSLGIVVQYDRDDRGRVVRATTPDGGVTLLAYDAMGNRVRVREPNGGERVISYDGLGLVRSFVDEAGQPTHFVYGAARELLQKQDADGRITHYSYDRDGNLVRISSPQGTDELSWGGYKVVCEVRKGDGSVISFRYDREGDMLRVINERGEVHTMERDSEGRVIAEHTFDGRTNRYRVDGLGRMVRMETDGGEIMEVEYDSLGRIAVRSLPDGSSETFAYDWYGRVTLADNGQVRCAFEYDARGQLVRETQELRGEAESVVSTFGASGRERLQTSRQLEQRTAFGPMGLPSEVLNFGASGPVRLRYDSRAQEIERTLPGGAVIRQGLDSLGRVAQRALFAPSSAAPVGPKEPEWLGAQPGILLEQWYTYDTDSSRPTRIDNSSRGAIDFEYDPLGQVRTRSPKGLTAETFSYQPGGSVLDPPGRDYAPGGVLTRRGSTSYKRDRAQRLVEKTVVDSNGAIATWRYEWNGKGLLSAVVAPNGNRTSYIYDCFARRIEKRTTLDDVLLTRVRYVWDRDAVLHELRESAAEGVVERSYATLNGSMLPFAHRDTISSAEGRRDSAWVYYLCEAGGRPEVLMDERGTSLASFDAKTFGRMEPLAERPSAMATSARFCGHWEDEESGLFYNRWRYFDPDACQYISPEPVGLPGGLHAFRYAMNRPLDAFDPDGLMFCNGTPGLPAAGSQSSQTVFNNTGQLNPIVEACLANPRQTVTDPAGCAEPHYLSNHLNSYTPPIVNDTDPRLRGALNDFKSNAYDEERDNQKRAPCPNCTQLFANMMAKYGAPNPANLGSGATQHNAKNNQNFTLPRNKKYTGGPTPYDTALATFKANNP